MPTPSTFDSATPARPGFRRGHVRIAVALALLIARPASAVDYDVYLLAGQSNMDGRGPSKDLVGDLLPFAAEQADVRIWYSCSSLRGPESRSDGWQPLRPGYSVPPGPGPRKVTSTQATTQSTPLASPRLSLRPAEAATTPAATEPGASATASTSTSTATSPSTSTATTSATLSSALRPLPRPAPRPVPGDTFGPEIGFAKTMTDSVLPPGRKLAIIKYSVGGANLRNEWNPRTKGKLYEHFLTYADAGLTKLKAGGDTVTLRGMLWHQGESDIALAPEAYQALLTDLITRVREDFHTPGLPVYLGEPYDNGRRLNVRAAQLLTAKALQNVYVIGSGGLETFDHGTHFDAASQIELGRRFAEAVSTHANVMASTMPVTMPVTMPAATQSATARAATRPGDDAP